MKLSNINAVFQHTFQKLLLTHTGWVIAACMLGILGYLNYQLTTDYLHTLSAQLQAPEITESITKTMSYGLTFDIIRPLFGYTIILYILIIPVLVLHLFSSEKQNGQINWLISCGFTYTDIILGKFLALMGYMLILQFFSNLIPVVFLINNTIDFGLWASLQLGLLLITGCLTALGLSLASLLPYTLITVALTPLIAIFWLLLQWLAPSFAAFSLSTHAYGILQGDCHLVDISFYVFTIIGLLYLAIIPAIYKTKIINNKNKKLSLLFSIFIFTPITPTLLVLSHFIIQQYPVHIDLTDNKHHTLSTTTVSLLNQISDPVMITLSSNDPDIILSTQAWVKKYQFYKKNIVFIQEKPLGSDKITFQLHHNPRQEILYLPHQVFNENTFTQALFKLFRNDSQWVVFLQGHGEPDPLGHHPTDFSLFTQALKNQGLFVQPIDLKQTQIIPENAAMLVIASPKTALLPLEENIIKNYIENGGNILWLSGPEEHSSLEIFRENLLGIQKYPGVVVDAYGQKLGTPHPGISIIDKYAQHPVTKNLNTVTAFPFASALKLKFAENSDIHNINWKTQAILTTHAHSWTETGKLSNTIEYNPELGEQSGPLDIGFALSRENQHIIIIGNTRFLSNGAIGNYGNLALGLGLINWLSEDVLLADITHPQAKDLSLDLNTISQWSIQFVFPVIIPGILLVIGVFVVRRRGVRQRKI